ncbi:hypothetical protein [Bacillus sp. USDA818B3_A]|uniref:hypothetical protein n=1 Tax=Bacillus sp. USDA818B3_A TaxID=2698834 RepID=UPI00136D54FE|nr:hypothetical protein [Bacillus sp. USDA818B3_A]
MEFIIREMKLEDIYQVQQVAKESWKSTYQGIIPLGIQERFLKAAYNDDMMQNRLENSFIWVSEVNRKIVGFASSVVAPTFFLLQGMKPLLICRSSNFLSASGDETPSHLS